MTLLRPSAVDSAIRRRSPSAAISGIDHHKRKLDDYAAFSDYGDMPYERMKKHESEPIDLSKDDFALMYGDISDQDFLPSSSTECSCSSESSTQDELQPWSNRLQFFVRMISEGKTIVVYADKNETVESLHRRIEIMTGIPVFEQRLIYGGRQLQHEHSLGDYSIERDALLNLVGRMRSTGHPVAWRVVDDMISTVWRMCRGEPLRGCMPGINEKLSVFFTMLPQDNKDSAAEYLRVFLASSAPDALVMLYVSDIEGNKEYADNSIRHFLAACISSLPKSLYSPCLPLVLAFCRLLRKFAPDQPLYVSCRRTLSSMLELVNTSTSSKNVNDAEVLMLGQEIFPFIRELADKLYKDLISSMEPDMSFGPLSSDLRDFSVFLCPLRNAILGEAAVKTGPITFPLRRRSLRSLFKEEIEYLQGVFRDLLNATMRCLDKIEVWLGSESAGNGEGMFTSSWSQYLAILKEISLNSELFQGAKEQLLSVLKSRKASFCALVMRFAKRADDHLWILEYKEATSFEVRRHLTMMMFPDVKEDYEELHEMLIDRSQLLAESFEYIGRAEPESLHSGLFMEFKNEEATGPGVLREWFFLVCQALFNPENALFVSCPADRRRFYPNPASKVDPMHLEYFMFAGRVIALALMHKVQVGVLFDRVFCLQLARIRISLEDIKDADPSMYRSCKQILEMDPEFVDSDALGLTFVREIEELGNRKVVELCPGGKSVAVNSKNRETYVDLLIQDRFVASVSEQISFFSRGFADILGNPKLVPVFFKSLELEDLDPILHGSGNDIDIEDWRAHTEYNGYKGTDRQVQWFWRIVKGMTDEQRRILLFFWTSIRYLPSEGFRGLASKLHIYKSYDPPSHLPSAHTCFYRLCLPRYPAYTLMEERLTVITQNRMCCSFGTW